MQRMTNNAGLDLMLAVWLAVDEYQYDTRPNVVSVSSLVKPLRQFILGRRVPQEQRIPDVADNVKRSIGHVLHRGIEHAWKFHYKSSLQKLGMPNQVVEAVRINPAVVEPDTIPVFTEMRSEKEIAGFILTGQVDFVIESRLRDAKSTTVWAYKAEKSVDSWKLQGSMYRWLNPEIITHDELLIQYLLLDWSGAGAKRDPGYPVSAVPTRAIPLLSLKETETWIINRLSQLKQYTDAPENEIPECTDEELWRSEPIFKYYANPNATGRSTKNFEGDNAEHDAILHMTNKGGVGRIDRVAGEAKACHYCPGFLACTQKDRLIAEGALFI